jgi:hypothetical protein
MRPTPTVILPLLFLAFMAAMLLTVAAKEEKATPQKLSDDELAKYNLRSATVRSLADTWDKCLADIGRGTEKKPWCNTYYKQIAQTPIDVYMPDSALMRKLASLTEQDIEALKRHVASVAMDAYDYGKERGR